MKKINNNNGDINGYDRLRSNNYDYKQYFEGHARDRLKDIKTREKLLNILTVLGLIALIFAGVFFTHGKFASESEVAGEINIEESAPAPSTNDPEETPTVEVETVVEPVKSVPNIQAQAPVKVVKKVKTKSSKVEVTSKPLVKLKPTEVKKVITYSVTSVKGRIVGSSDASPELKKVEYRSSPYAEFKQKNAESNPYAALKMVKKKRLNNGGKNLCSAKLDKLPRFKNPRSQELSSFAVQTALQHNLDPVLFVRQMAKESGFNPKARSYVGAGGICQFMPTTARQYGLMSSEDVLNPYSNIYAGCEMMAKLLKIYKNHKKLNPSKDLRKAYMLALAAYNGGHGGAVYLSNNPQYFVKPCPCKVRYIKTKKGNRKQVICDSYCNQTASYVKSILLDLGNCQPDIDISTL